VNYIGVDAPAVDSYFGSNSKNKNYQLVAWQKLLLIADNEISESESILHRYVISNAKFVNYEMIFSGFAKYTSHQSKASCYSKLQGANRNAQTNKSGLWLPTATPYPTSAPAPTQSSSTRPWCVGRYFSLCADMKAAGCAPAYQGIDDWYRSARDRDKDGIACE